MEKISIKFNGKEYQVENGLTILEAAKACGIVIPTLCYMKEINAIGSCRICVVEVKGARSMVAACVHPVSPGMEISTISDKVLNARKMTLELILSNHNRECTTCIRNLNCELQTLAHAYGVEEVRFGDLKELQTMEKETSTNVIMRDNSKCILCRRCVSVCQQNQDVAVIGTVERGFNTHIACAFETPLADAACVNCGQCIVNCPVGALHEKDQVDEVLAAIHDPTKHVVVAPAPSVRVHMGEFYGAPVGTNVEGKLAAALRHCGFDKVFDVDTAADLTIMEEGTELLTRIKEGGKLPLITSCSPGWVKYIEHYYPEMLAHVSSCRSPQGMYGAYTKSAYAELSKIDAKDIVTVAIMPCTAKKYEAARPEMTTNGHRSIDIVLTSRELARMLERLGIDFASLPEEEFDDPFGIASGAGHIFGATGGVMEAALRTVAEVVEGKPLEKLDFMEVRGVASPIKEATYKVGDLDVNVCVTSGLANARKVLEDVKAGRKNYHFIEIMACPGGCVNGGGQPIKFSSYTNFNDVRVERAAGLYDSDKNMTLRKSHENPAITKLYEEFFEGPGKHKAHEYLHTTYTPREIYKK